MLLLLLTGAGFRDNGRPVYRKLGPDIAEPKKPKTPDDEEGELVAILSAMLATRQHLGHKPEDTS